MIEQIKRHEGFRNKPYHDTEGVLTVGYGHNLDEPMSHELAEIILHYDLQNAVNGARSMDYYAELNQPRKDAIINMIFNLGITKFRGFKRMNAALNNEDFDLAAVEALDSRWALQVGDRARELAAQIRNGTYAEL